MEKEKKDLHWYKDAIIYELHVRSFYDSNGDGIGDFAGVIQKLDYLQFLGVTVIWILPFYPSPLKDDGYDISDYYDVNPIYGNLVDFKRLLNEAHKRNIKVMTELVINHTSNEHSWFKRARKSPSKSKWRNYYVWSDTPDKYQEARIIFKDFETSNWSWDPEANAYYWHRFYSHQPDLNYDNPEVLKEIFKIMDFWFKLGVDGMRLDAIPYLFEREGTPCENLPETHDVLKKIRAHIDSKFSDKFILAEANQWPDDAVAYFGNGDECHMAFHFPMMPRMYTAIEMEDAFPLMDILQQTPPIPENCQWSTFLRNHDELTLEMVTDEERDYLYRIYADDPQMRVNLGIRRRLAPLMKGDRRKIELMNVLLFTLPGTPVIYYGDEIGMGDNIYLGDRNGVRTPMQWSSDLNSGFSTANPQKLFLPVVIDPDFNYSAINVELQKQNDQSMLWWIKRFISMRKRFKAFSRGQIKFLVSDNNKVLAFLRIYDDEVMLIVTNLSRFSQFVELSLDEYIGKYPVELFSDNKFPKITKNPYMFTMNPYSYLCFNLLDEKAENDKLEYKPREITIQAEWLELINSDDKSQLENVLAAYLPYCRWFGNKADKIYAVKINALIPIDKKKDSIYLMIFDVNLKEKTESYTIFIANTVNFEPQSKNEIIAVINNEQGKQSSLVDALLLPTINRRLLNIFLTKKKFKTDYACMLSKPTTTAKRPLVSESDIIKIVDTEQTNTSVIFDNKYILKLFRRNQVGENPDVELSRFLMKNTKRKISPIVISTLEFVQQKKHYTLAMVQEYIFHSSTAWNHTIEALKVYFEKASVLESSSQCPELPPSIFKNIVDKVPDDIYELLGIYSNSVGLLGEKTAEMHLALANHKHEDNFKTELFSYFDQRSLYQSIHSLSHKSLTNLQKKIHLLDEMTTKNVTELFNNHGKIEKVLNAIIKAKIKGVKIRCHGDYHLGQILFTGKDFLIIDYEGEPDRSLSERKIKRSPLKDVASILRSFSYAVYAAIYELVENGTYQQHILDKWGKIWYAWVTQLFLKSYLEKISHHHLIPEEYENIALLLRFYMIEKAFYEIQYEINHRPKWLQISCQGLLNLIEE